MLAASNTFSSKFLTAFSSLSCIFSNLESRLKDISKSELLTLLLLLIPGVPWGLEGCAEEEECGDGGPHDGEAQEEGCCGDKG